MWWLVALVVLSGVPSLVAIGGPVPIGPGADPSATFGARQDRDRGELEAAEAAHREAQEALKGAEAALERYRTETFPREFAEHGAAILERIDEFLDPAMSLLEHGNALPDAGEDRADDLLEDFDAAIAEVSGLAVGLKGALEEASHEGGPVADPDEEFGDVRELLAETTRAAEHATDAAEEVREIAARIGLADPSLDRRGRDALGRARSECIEATDGLKRFLLDRAPDAAPHNEQYRRRLEFLLGIHAEEVSIRTARFWEIAARLMPPDAYAIELQNAALQQARVNIVSSITEFNLLIEYTSRATVLRLMGDVEKAGANALEASATLGEARLVP